MFGLEPDPAQYKQSKYQLDEFVILLCGRNPIDLNNPDLDPNIDLILRSNSCDQDSSILIKMKAMQRVLARELMIDPKDNCRPLIECQELLKACHTLDIDCSAFQRKKNDSRDEECSNISEFCAVNMAIIVDVKGFRTQQQYCKWVEEWVASRVVGKRGYSEKSVSRRVKVMREQLKELGLDCFSKS